MYSSLLLHAIHCCGLQFSQGRGKFPEGADTLEGFDEIVTVVVLAFVVVGTVVASVEVE